MPPLTRVVGFPFDAFGAPGTSAGAELLLDALRELRRDARRETRPTRTTAFEPHLRLFEQRFETPDELSRWRDAGRRLARRCLREPGDRTLWLSGNHLGVLPVLDALPAGTLVLQLDAHLDIYQFADSTTTLSHGNFLARRKNRESDIVTVGHRDLFLTDAEIRAELSDHVPAPRWHADRAGCLARLASRVSAAPAVWLDLDFDAVDPAHFPAVALPTPFGLSGPDVMALLSLCPPDKCLGLSLSEFMPAGDERDRSLEWAMWLIEWWLLRMYDG